MSIAKKESFTVARVVATSPLAQDAVIQTHINKVFSERIKNPIISGIAAAVAGQLSSAALGMVRRAFLTTCSTDNPGWGNKALMAERILLWYMSTPYAKHTSDLRIVGGGYWMYEDEENLSQDTRKYLGVGYGRHYFIFKKRLGWLEYNKPESDKTSESVTVTLITSNRALMRDFLLEVQRVATQETVKRNYVKRWQGDGWKTKTEIKCGCMDNLFINERIKNDVISRIKWFRENRAWFETRNIPYQLVIMLYGPPGTGKTSLARACASYFEGDLGELPLGSINDEQLSDAALSAKDMFLVSEDLHGIKALLAPEYQQAMGDKLDLSQLSGISLSGYLNVLNGVSPLDGTVWFLTCNHQERLATEVVRKGGRMDMCIYLGNMTDPEIRAFLLRMFRDEADVASKVGAVSWFPEVPGATLTTAYQEYHSDLDELLRVVVEQDFDQYTQEAQKLAKEAELLAQARAQQAVTDALEPEPEAVPSEASGGLVRAKSTRS